MCGEMFVSEYYVVGWDLDLGSGSLSSVLIF